MYVCVCSDMYDGGYELVSWKVGVSEYIICVVLPCCVLCMLVYSAVELTVLVLI